MPRKTPTPKAQPFAPELPKPKKAPAAKKGTKATEPRMPTPAESVAAIFSRDPQSLVPEDRRKVVEAARRARTQWEIKEAAQKRKKDGGGDEDLEDKANGN